MAGAQGAAKTGARFAIPPAAADAPGTEESLELVDRRTASRDAPAPVPAETSARGPATRGERIAWLDNARGIGIALVVAGHALTPGHARDVIYAFHMPLFFFLAGVTAPATAGQPLSRQAARLARGLLVPFAFFGTVTLVYNTGARWIERSHVPGWPELLQSAATIA